MRITGVILTLGYYVSLLVFFGTYAAKALTWARSSPAKTARPEEMKMKTIMKGVCDILFLRRLLAVNDLLWIGEWIFHVSFVLVILRHLRYFLDPVPQWVWVIQTPGIIAGYVLPLSLAYVLVVKLLIEKKRYVSTYNFFLLVLIFVISVSGLLMQTAGHPDVVSVKAFIMGIMTFEVVAAPEDVFFIAHFIMVLAFMVSVPAHVFAAPLVLIDARQREEALRTVVHEE